MTTPLSGDRLSELLRDAVADVEPSDRLTAIRARTARQQRAAARPWLYAAAATALVAAAATGTFALLDRGDAPEPAPSHQSHAVDPTPTPSAHSVPAYFVGETPRGLRLFREFDVRTGTAGLGDALAELQEAPDDPDYRTLWPAGSLTSITRRGDVYAVEIGDASLHDRPAGMSPEEAGLAIEQVVYTVQAAAHGRVPVQFLLDGNPINEVYGVPTSEPLANAPQTDVLSLVQISDPVEGLEVTGSFTARGAASSFEATVPWEIRDGDTVVEKGVATAEGWMNRLYPWETTIDVSDLQPGEYTFAAMTDDPSGGAEGAEPFVDTRTITVR
ncbi:Gmad2 immunoglobulin-like domain-containing protein [Nocardioides sp.]|uniref:Gmad2 immunoglobulin-like domain-containing protein n=1 Tax=Nocardioides sp. TaxID=35761 RepID=UPI0025F50D2E|nr:Gmad2 immunoglobulin-like domain-containing protein [Nocardioides sp.]